METKAGDVVSWQLLSEQDVTVTIVVLFNMSISVETDALEMSDDEPVVAAGNIDEIDESSDTALEALA